MVQPNISPDQAVNLGLEIGKGVAMGQQMAETQKIDALKIQKPNGYDGNLLAQCEHNNIGFTCLLEGNDAFAYTPSQICSKDGLGIIKKSFAMRTKIDRQWWLPIFLSLGIGFVIMMLSILLQAGTGTIYVLDTFIAFIGGFLVPLILIYIGLLVYWITIRQNIGEDPFYRKDEYGCLKEYSLHMQHYHKNNPYKNAAKIDATGLAPAWNNGGFGVSVYDMYYATQGNDRKRRDLSAISIKKGTYPIMPQTEVKMMQTIENTTKDIFDKSMWGVILGFIFGGTRGAIAGSVGGAAFAGLSQDQRARPLDLKYYKENKTVFKDDLTDILEL